MNYTKRAIQGASIVIAMYLLSGFLGYLLRFLLARNLTAHDYGLFYAVFSFVLFFSVFTDFGLSFSTIKFIPEYLAKKKPERIKSIFVLVFSFRFIMSVIISLVLFFSSRWLSVNYFKETLAQPIIQIFSISFVLLCLASVFISMLQGFQRMFLYSLMDFLKVFLTLLFSSLFLLLFRESFSVFVPSVAYGISFLFLLILSSFFVFRTMPTLFSHKLAVDTKLIRSLFTFGIPVTLASLSSLIITSIDTMVLTYFKSLTDVAYYNVAMPISLILMYLFAHPLSSILLPMSSEMWAKGHKKSLKAGIEKIHRYVILGIVPSAIVVMSFPEIFINLLFGSQYLAAKLPLQVLALGTIFYSIAFINSNIFSGIGKPQEGTKILFSVALLNFILNVALVPSYGIIGAASATAISYFAMMIATIIKLKRFISLQFDVLYFVKSVLVGLLTAGIIFFLKNLFSMHYLAELACVAVIAGIFYVSLSFFLRLITKKDINDILALFFRRK